MRALILTAVLAARFRRRRRAASFSMCSTWFHCVPTFDKFHVVGRGPELRRAAQSQIAHPSGRVQKT